VIDVSKLSEIRVGSRVVKGSKCPRCGMKVFPPSLLTSHLGEHEKKKRELNQMLKDAQKRLKVSRL